MFGFACDGVGRRFREVVDTDRERYMCWCLEFTDEFCGESVVSWCSDTDFAFWGDYGYDAYLQLECGSGGHEVLSLGE